MTKLMFVSVLLFVGTVFAEVPLTPNPEISPGAICTTRDSHFREYRYPERIVYCKRSVSKRLKADIYETYGIPKHCRKHYTIDHIIPLSIGGNNRVENLWPEHKAVKQTRKDLEYDVYLALKDGAISQEYAINRILEEKFNPNIPVDFNPSPNCPSSKGLN